MATPRDHLINDEDYRALENVSKKLAAGMEVIGRTGAEFTQVRFCDEDEPTLWMAYARYPDGGQQVAAALDLEEAVMRLCAQLINGGSCRHCHRGTGFTPRGLTTAVLDLSDICLTFWDDDAQAFTQACRA